MEPIRLFRFEKPSILDANAGNNFILITCDLMKKNIPNLYIKILTFQIKIFNFKLKSDSSSGDPKSCNLLHYHSSYRGEGCQFIGFFHRFADHQKIIDDFGKDRIPYVLDTNFIYNSRNFDKIGKIDSIKKYQGKYPKDLYFFISKLELEGSRVGFASKDREGEHETYSDPTYGKNRIEDEYIIIGNLDIPIFTINIPEMKDEKERIKYLSEIITKYFLIDQDSDEYKIMIKDFNTNKNTNPEINSLTSFTSKLINFTELRKIIRTIQYELFTQIQEEMLKKINLYDTDERIKKILDTHITTITQDTPIDYWIDVQIIPISQTWSDTYTQNYKKIFTQKQEQKREQERLRVEQERLRVEQERLRVEKKEQNALWKELEKPFEKRPADGENPFEKRPADGKNPSAKRVKIKQKYLKYKNKYIQLKKLIELQNKLQT